MESMLRAIMKKPSTRSTRTGGILFCLFASVLAVPFGYADSTSLKRLFEPGYFALMRHSLAPGSGDPAGFKLENCDTQRNLSEAGRAQARVAGEMFREQGILEANVFSSQWCRCLETAALLDSGDVSELAALNSFFENWSQEEGRTLRLLEWLRTHIDNAPIILVTHQVNITALSGVFPSSGEIVVSRLMDNGDVNVVGTVAVPVPGI